MNRNRIIAALVLLALAFWLVRWCQPERQVRRAQARLLSALETGDFDSLAEIFADDYRDAWGHDKAFVLRQSKRVLPLLDITRDERSLEAAAPSPTGQARWILRERLTMGGLGPPIAMHIRDRVNQLRQPFTMIWRKKGWKPWDWELTSLEQPEISAAELESEW